MAFINVATETRMDDSGHVVFGMAERRCSECNESVPHMFTFHCPRCGAVFSEVLIDYVPEEG